MSAGTPIVTVPRPGAAVVQRWQPARGDIHQYSADAQNRAAVSRAAFQPELERYGHLPAIPGQCSRAIQQKLGISERWVRQRWNLYIGRDRGFNEWHRHDLYLDDSPPLPPPKTIRQYDHSDLGHRLVFANPARPTLSERQLALHKAFDHFEDLAANFPDDRREIKVSILNYLWQTAPALARSYKAIVRNWNRQYAKRKNVIDPAGRLAAIADRRPGNSGNYFDWSLIEADIKLIAAEAREHDGKIQIAYRKLRRASRLSQTFVDRYTLDVRRNKSYSAKSIRAEIKARLEGTLEYRRSQWAANMAGPRIPRCHDNYSQGDRFGSDDVSWNILFWADRNGRRIVTVGECLAMFDCRSLYPLGYILTGDKYNGETIRRLLLHIHNIHGLPHRGFIFEQGVWESRLLAPANNPRDFLGWADYELGLESRGLKVGIHNAETPQAKLIEVIFNLVQQNQRCEPTFAGFNRRNYRNEKLEKLISQANRGVIDPAEHFPSMQQWRDRLDRYMEEYANEPQNGKLLQGKSPAEMWADHRPLRKLAPHEMFLLSTHRVQKTVKQNGIGITIRGHRRFFFSAELGREFGVGRSVWAYYNIEQPDLLTVSSLDRKKFLSIKYKELDFADASNENLAAMRREINGFMEPKKLLADAMHHDVRRSIQRDNRLDPDTEALGAHQRQATEQHAEEQSQQRRKTNLLLRTAEETATGFSRKPQDVDRSIKARKRLAERRARFREAQHLIGGER